MQSISIDLEYYRTIKKVAWKSEIYWKKSLIRIVQNLVDSEIEGMS